MIGKYKNLDEDEIEDFINEFLKIGFYMPHITKNKYQQDIQIHIIKKNIKNFTL